MTPTISLFFFFNDTATTEIYTLSLHDALPIFVLREHVRSLVRCRLQRAQSAPHAGVEHRDRDTPSGHPTEDRKSTRLNSSHLVISYAVFCLKKKKTAEIPIRV